MAEIKFEIKLETVYTVSTGCLQTQYNFYYTGFFSCNYAIAF